MQGILNLPCTVCNSEHNYDSLETIAALEVEWKISDEKNARLLEKPQLNKLYKIQITSPITLNLKNTFWVVHLNDQTSLDGFESIEDVQSVNFNKCRATDTVTKTDNFAILTVEVLQQINLEDIQLEIKTPLQPPGWELLTAEVKARKHLNVRKLGNYWILEVNVQSDLGLTVLVYKSAIKTTIVAVNEWDFHRNYWHLCSYDLSDDRISEFGIG